MAFMSGGLAVRFFQRRTPVLSMATKQPPGLLQQGITLILKAITYPTHSSTYAIVFASQFLFSALQGFFVD